MKILRGGFEDSVRVILGVTVRELPDNQINNPMIATLAESVIIQKVPNYENIDNDTDDLFLENAVVYYICHLLAPTMGRRVNTEVTSVDVKWKKARIDWEALAQSYLTSSDSYLMKIESVDVAVAGDTKVTIMGIASTTDDTEA